MTRETSAEAYRWITESPILQRLHRQICEVLASRYFPMTTGEIAEAIEPKPRINAISPRMAELRRMGSAIDGTARKCKITGRMSITWSLTGNEPVKPPEIVPEVCPHCRRGM